MKSLLWTKETVAWLVLAGLTGISWFTGNEYAIVSVESYKYITMGLLVLAFFKIRLVVMYFMEIGNAPIPLKAIFEVWIAGVCAVMIILYLNL